MPNYERTPVLGYLRYIIEAWWQAELVELTPPPPPTQSYPFITVKRYCQQLYRFWENNYVITVICVGKLLVNVDRTFLYRT